MVKCFCNRLVSLLVYSNTKIQIFPLLYIIRFLHIIMYKIYFSVIETNRIKNRNEFRLDIWTPKLYFIILKV